MSSHSGRTPRTEARSLLMHMHARVHIFDANYNYNMTVPFWVPWMLKVMLTDTGQKLDPGTEALMNGSGKAALATAQQKNTIGAILD